MNLSALQHIPLASAFLCETCQSVGNNERRCPACAGVNLLPLAGVLDRTTLPQGAPGDPDGFWRMIESRRGTGSL